MKTSLQPKVSSRPLLVEFRRRFTIAILVAVFTTFLTIIFMTNLTSRRNNIRLEKMVDAYVQEHLESIASQIYIYETYKIPLDPIFIKELHKIGGPVILAVENAHQICLLGDCAFFHSTSANYYKTRQKEIRLADTKVGILHIGVPVTSILQNVDFGLIGFFLVLFLLFLISQYVFSKFIQTKIHLPLQNLLASFKALEQGAFPPSSSPETEQKYDIVEMELLFSSFGEMAAKLNALHQLQRRQFANEELYRLSAQVAHDIRSPLAALQSVERDLPQLPDDLRLLLRTALNRIHDIANTLIHKNRDLSHPVDDSNLTTQKTEQAPSVQLASGVIDAIISEKRMQHVSQKISINLEMDEQSYRSFVEVPSVTFGRVISNLINNSMDAISTSGSIIVKLTSTSDRVLVQVIDSGKGIPADILPKLMNHGATFGKEDGMGLGLYHARVNVEAMDGTIEIASEIGKGTAVTISLPRAPAPSWFVSELSIDPNTDIIILDDDESIHQTWKKKLNRVSNSLSVLHLKSPSELRESLKEPCNGSFKPTLFLIDYEYSGLRETGLELIEELGIAATSALVTNNYYLPEIQSHCDQIGLRMIPKYLLDYLAIQIRPVA